MFQYYQPTKIHFGIDQLQEIGTICQKYGKRCFLVTTADAPLQPLYERVLRYLAKEGIFVCHFDKVEPNPSVAIVEEGLALANREAVDVVLAIGGGSSIDTAKAIAFTYGQKQINWDEIFAKFQSPFEDYEPYNECTLPLISVPTTSGTGSQVTQASVITRGKEKITFFHQAIFSKECIIDPTLMLTLPLRLSAATGFDAFTHAFESYINPRASFYSEMDSIAAMKLIIANLPMIMKEPHNVTYRTNMCLADTLAGRALANSGAAAPHPLSEIIGGITHLPHGEALAIVFPSFIKYMETMNKDKFQFVANMFHEGATDLYKEIVFFLESISLHKKMQDFQVTQVKLQEMLASPILDCLPFGSRTDLEAILKDAYA